MKDWLRPVMKWDARLSKKLRIPDHRHWLAILLKIVAHSGDSWFWLAGLFLVWLFGASAWRERAVFLGVGLTIMATVVIIMKYAIHRPRPEGEWGQIYRITDPHSFPSGHAARSAALAVMAICVGPEWFAWAVALWAPWVGISRVALGVHYVSDVVVGWLVGAAMGLVAIALEPVIIQWFSWLI
jgi:undecaprenyl-diphosphatase